jgi:hypothetical protein
MPTATTFAFDLLKRVRERHPTEVQWQGLQKLLVDFTENEAAIRFIVAIRDWPGEGKHPSQGSIVVNVPVLDRSTFVLLRAR